MRNAPNRARLDVDELEGYGPETITLDRIDARQTYDLSVYNYSNDADFKAVELIYVYAGNSLVKEIRLPATKKRSLHVLRIKNGQYTFINKPIDQKP